MSDLFTEEAKELLLAQLRVHSDPGVRIMAEFGLSDDTPHVQTIAAALRARAAMEASDG